MMDNKEISDDEARRLLMINKEISEDETRRYQMISDDIGGGKAEDVRGLGGSQKISDDYNKGISDDYARRYLMINKEISDDELGISDN